MANDSLEHDAHARHSDSEIPKTLHNKTSNFDVFGATFGSMTFSLTFTASEWCLFWRLLNVGCMLSDELLEWVSYPKRVPKPATALLWNQLSSEFAALLQAKEEVSPKVRSMQKEPIKKQ